MQGVASFRFFFAQPDSATNFNKRTPWPCCRTHGLDPPTSSTITACEEPQAGFSSVALKPTCTMCLLTYFESKHFEAVAKTRIELEVSL